MRTVERINEDIKYYIEVRTKAEKERKFRTVEGAQWSIDKCMNELRKINYDKR